jgi:hypothetical protein
MVNHKIKVQIKEVALKHATLIKKNSLNKLQAREILEIKRALYLMFNQHLSLSRI